jgi:hypothetical protein
MARTETRLSAFSKCTATCHVSTVIWILDIDKNSDSFVLALAMANDEDHVLTPSGLREGTPSPLPRKVPAPRPRHVANDEDHVLTPNGLREGTPSPLP